MPTDPKVLAMRLAVVRWKKMPDDPIAQELDDPHEWVREAGMMNQLLPNVLLKEGFGWQSVHPAELKAAQIEKVRQYAGFLFTHIRPLVLEPAPSLESPAEPTAHGGEPDERAMTYMHARALGMHESEIDALYED